MSFAFPDYVKVKDNYCCCYLGNTLEYIVQLKLLRKSIEKQLPGIKIFISCKDSYLYLLNNEENIVPLSKINKTEFAHIREITFSEKHPILELMTESELQIEPISLQNDSKKGICLLCPEGLMPTKCLKPKEVECAKQWIVSNGYVPVILGSDINQVLEIEKRPSGNEKFKYINECVAVVSVENEYLFLAGEREKSTFLIPTGVGENLYKQMFPNGKVLKLNLQ